MSEKEAFKHPTPGRPGKTPEDEKGDKKFKFNKGKGKPKEVRFPKRNDPAYYTKFKELSDNAARLPFNHRNGSKINYMYKGANVDTNIDPIMVIDYVPTIGISESKDSGINIISNAQYKVLNRKYRGSMASKYQTADVGITQFGVLDFFLSLAQAERVYGIVQEVRVNQKQCPRELLMAAGYDYESFSTGLADYRAALNEIILRAKSLCLVKGYSLLDHHLFLLSNVFKDKDTQRANYFMYRKRGYWKWQPTLFKTGSALKWIDDDANKFINDANNEYAPLLTVPNVIDALKDQLDALLADSDIDTICADILAYFGNDNDNPNLVMLAQVPEAYTTIPLFDENALYQLHNTTVMCGVHSMSTRGNAKVEDNYFTQYPNSILNTGDTVLDKGLVIYQVDDTIKFNVTVNVFNSNVVTTVDSDGIVVRGNSSDGMSAYEIQKGFLDTDKLSPTPDDIMEMTRQFTLGYSISRTISGTTHKYLAMRCFSTMLPVRIAIFEFYKVGNRTLDSNGDIYFASGEIHIHKINTAYCDISNICALSKFDWAPIVVEYVGNHVFGDLDNYITVDQYDMGPINDVAVLSEFSNPLSDLLIVDK